MNEQGLRRIDAAVAEHVFGATAEGWPDDWPTGIDEDGAPYPRLPQYSTDIAAAMEAAEKVMERTRFRFQCGYSAGITGEPRWWAFFGDPNDASASDPDSLAYCIALAALRAVGHDTVGEAT